MFIETHSTPNPATIKFIPHQAIAPVGTALDFRSGDDTSGAPLAARLFKLDGIEGVYIAADFISVTKQGPYDWAMLKVDVLTAIMDHIASGAPAVTATRAKPPAASADHDLDTEIVQQIKELVETRVRPAVAADGGDIVFSHFENGVVYLEMRGACAGCPSSTATLKNGIENMLKHYIPEVTDVQAA